MNAEIHAVTGFRQWVHKELRCRGQECRPGFTSPAPLRAPGGLLSLYARHPEGLTHGYQDERVMFSPPGHVTKEGLFGIDGLRIFMPTEAFDELSTQCPQGSLAEALTGLRCLY